jgi:large subunit ribosomal protein L11
MITRKHVYEIAKIKQEDELWQEFDLKDICDIIIDKAYQMGVRVVDHLDPKEYGKFLHERAEIVAKEKAEIQAAREAKLLRT